MDYVDALRLLRDRDDWERSGSAADAVRWKLGRMHSLLTRLGDPHLGRRTVHVAGSKGKGSTAAMIASVLQAAGVSTGLYTKPHLHRFVERIAVDGEPIDPDDFGRLVGKLAPQLEAEDAQGEHGAVSTFEALVALAFLCFREREVAWQVLEVGLGGRLDATNVFEQKDVCVIAPIGLEHTAILGDTVAQIAEEKAAIITPGTTVIMAPQRESAADVVRRVCGEREATLIEVAEVCGLSRTSKGVEGQEFSLRTPQSTYKLKLPLLGQHQVRNAATAVLALEALAEHGVAVDEHALRQGLASLSWRCRIDPIRHRPLVIADGAHNRDSAKALVRTVRDDLKRSDVVLVVGCSNDKDVDALAEELAPLASEVITTRSRHPRALDPRRLATAFAEREVPVAIEEPVGAAVDVALTLAGDGGTVVVCGSLFVAAEAREHLLGIEYDPPLAGRAVETQRTEVNA